MEPVDRAVGNKYVQSTKHSQNDKVEEIGQHPLHAPNQAKIVGLSDHLHLPYHLLSNQRSMRH